MARHRWPQDAPSLFPRRTPKGPYLPTWDSIREHYSTPDWFKDAKFGIFIHWGLYFIPAYHNEWYSKHMYGQFAQWHTEHYGPPDVFGYKDFIPMFKAAKYDPDQWAELFKQAGTTTSCRWPTPRRLCHVGQQRHALVCRETGPETRFDRRVGGGRAETGAYLRRIQPSHGTSYVHVSRRGRQKRSTRSAIQGFLRSAPVPGNMNDGNASPQFQEDWLFCCRELVDKYNPQIFHFDNGVNARAYDPIKLRFAAYYYNRAYERNEQVSITTKDSAFLAGNIEDFEKVGTRSPRNIFPGYWQIDDPIGNTWGYTHDETFSSSAVVLGKLIDTVSKGGALMVNVSPNGDGVIVDPQPQRLLEIGRWLAVNGEAIYGTRLDQIWRRALHGQ